MLTSTALVLLMIPGVGYVDRLQACSMHPQTFKQYKLTQTPDSSTRVSHDVNQHCH
jgi:hypothetical protein